MTQGGRNYDCGESKMAPEARGCSVPMTWHWHFASACVPRTCMGRVLLRPIWMQWASPSHNPDLPPSWTPSPGNCPPPEDGVGQVTPQPSALTPTLNCLPRCADSIFQIHPLFVRPLCGHLARTPRFPGDSQHAPLGVCPSPPHLLPRMVSVQ